MARKDVNLVIRARDEAGKVLDSITEALNDFLGAQAGLDSRAEKTESSLSSLGAAIKKLDTAMSSLSAGDKLGQQFAKAEDDIRRMETALKSNQRAVNEQTQALRRAEAQASRYAAKLAGAAAAQERQSAVVKRAKADQQDLTKAYEQAVAAQTRLSAQQDKLPGQIDRQAAAVDKAAARYEKLQAAMAGTVTPSQTLQNNFASSARNLDQQTTKLEALRGKYAAIQSELRAAASAVVLFGGSAQKATSNLASQERVLDKIGQNYTVLGDKSKIAARGQSELEGRLNGTTASLRKQEAALDRAEQSYVEMADAAGKFNAALNATSGAARGNLEKQLVDQGIAAQKAKQEFLELDEAARRLRAQIGAVGVPTRQAAQSLAFAAQRADEAQMKFLLQEESLDRLGRAYRDVSNDIQSIAGGQARFVSEQQRLGAAMQQAANDGFRQRQAVRELHRATTTAAGSMGRLASATQGQATAAARSATETSRLAQAYRGLYGDTRRSLSLTQRLRGEVLSLVAAYGGLYGVISILRQVTDAYQTLEAAQARLNVVTQGDQTQTAKELDFLERTAARLGIEMGVLATEYSKFSIATQNTNLEGAATRKIFLSVAEAARVNRSSVDEMAGVFLALTQIVSKGAVQMEELRQQLGDRLPGALKIMADGLGLTTAELVKMMELGEISSDALVPFAEELDRRFGPGLAEALTGTTTALGRLKNAAFQALVSFGQGGFIDSLTDFANDLTEVLDSAKFESFSNKVSTAFGGLMDVIAILARNFDLVVSAATAFLALKMAPFLILLVTKFGEVTAGARAMALATAAGATSVTAVGAASAVAATRVGLLARSLQLLTSSTGIGLIITAIGAGIGYWATQADIATESLSNHEKMVDDVRNAYDAAGGAVENWNTRLEDLTITQARRNLQELQDGLRAAENQFVKAFVGDGETFAQNFFGLSAFTGASRAYNNAIETVFKNYRTGKIDANALRVAVDEINEQFNDGSSSHKRYANALDEATEAIVKFGVPLEEAERLIRLASASSEEAQQAFDEFGNTAREVGNTFEERLTKALEDYNVAMETLKKDLPDLRTEMEKFADTIEGVELSFDAALRAARAMPDAIMRIAAEQEVLGKKTETMVRLAAQQLETFTSGTLVDRIIGVESGGDPTARNPNSTATGVGQFIEATWLRMFKQYFPDRAEGMTNAMILALREDASLSRNMVDLYIKENARILQRLGIELTDANLYLAHFLGPGGAAALLQSAPGTSANSVLSQGAIDSNQSVLDGKTREEVIAWAQKKVGISETELEIVETLNDMERRAAEDRRKEVERAQEATATRLADGEFEIRQQELINEGKGRQAAIESALRDARAENPGIAQAELDIIAQQAARLYDVANAEEASNAAKERAAAAEERINQLLEQRTALQAQMEVATQRGEDDKAEELRAKMEEVNAELLLAIENAKLMWEAVGGGAADTAIAKLEVAKLGAEDFGKLAEKNYLEWDRLAELFIGGMTNAVLQFAQAVAEGQNRTEALKTAFMQFAAEFLLQIARMIIQQALLNALKAAFGGTSFGAMIGLAHGGGVIGSSRAGSGNSVRSVNPAMFSGAMRYHTGGIVGLMPNEVPIIAKKGEEMLTEDDPRHAKNGGLGGSGSKESSVVVRNINTFDAAGFLEAALDSPVGERVLLNFVSSKSRKIQSALDT